MAVEYTVEQKNAIELDGTNLLVSASAGTGKTAVLTQRVLRLVGSGASLEKMLIVTYTNAAAAQMRARIVEALEEGGFGSEIIDSASRARICTIHSFCAAFLREFFDQAGIEPLFRVLDGASEAAMKSEAISEALESVLLDADDSLTADIRALGGIDAAGECAMRLYQFTRSRPDPDEWVDGAVNSYWFNAARIEKSAWAADIVGSIHDSAKKALYYLESANRMLENAGGDVKAQGVISCDIAQAQTVLSEKTYAGLSRFKPVFERWAKSSAGIHTQAAKEMRDSAKKALELCLPAPPVELARETCAAMYSPIKTIALIMKAFQAAYEKMKADAECLDFSDLEHKTLKALEYEAVREASRARYEHIFVDEYQDANAVQEAIISGISRGGNVFMVGDIKQSIYGFRMADPRIFAEKYDRYCSGDGGRRVDLTSNFRSLAGILHFANDVFSSGNADIGGVEYGENARLKPFLHGECPPVGIDIIDLKAVKASEGDCEGHEIEGEVEEALRELTSMRAESKIISERIKTTLDSLFIDINGILRRALPQDIAVLLRSPGSWSGTLDEAFRETGIPFSGGLGEGYYGKSEVRMAMAVFLAVDNRMNDLALIHAMTAPFSGFTPAELAHIRAASGGNGSFFSAVKAYSSGYDDLSKRCQEFLDNLLKWRDIARNGSPDECARDILELSGCQAFVSSLPFGSSRRANLRLLCSRAASCASFSEFVLSIKKESEAGADAEPESAAGQAVRVMSIHKSKGLEFPVVILGGLGRKFNDRDSRERFLTHREKGLALDFFDPEYGIRQTTIARMSLAAAIKNDNVEEEKRVLYVALTRARNAMYITACFNGLESRISEWEATEHGFEGQSAGCLFDFIAPMLLSHPDCATVLSFQPAKARLSRIDIRVITGEGSFEAESGHESASDIAYPAGDVPDWIFDRLRWRYEPSKKMPPKKTAVTELSREEERIEPPRPLFAQEQSGLTGAERGTAAHAAIGLLDKGKLYGLDFDETAGEIARQIDSMVESGALTPKQAQSIAVVQIARFFTSETGMAALNSPRLLCEQPFEMLIGRDELPDPNEAAGADFALVQGEIDMCFETAEGWIVIDFKSGGRLTGQSAKWAYSGQVGLYMKAVARAFGRPVKGMVYLLASGEVVWID